MSSFRSQASLAANHVITLATCFVACFYLGSRYSSGDTGFVRTLPHSLCQTHLCSQTLQALVCGVIGGIGGLIVEVILFIIKGSQLDAAAERARKRGGERRVQRPTRPPKELMAEAEASVAAAAAGTGIDNAPTAPSSESKKEA